MQTDRSHIAFMGDPFPIRSFFPPFYLGISFYPGSYLNTFEQTLFENNVANDKMINNGRPYSYTTSTVSLISPLSLPEVILLTCPTATVTRSGFHNGMLSLKHYCEDNACKNFSQAENSSHSSKKKKKKKKKGRCIFLHICRM
jgi:hypothetical protein